MLVNKPQFDTEKLQPKQVYHLYRGFKSVTGKRVDTISTPCIIKRVEPLFIEVVFLQDDSYDGGKNEIKSMTITIDQIVNKEIELTEMVRKDRV